MTLQEQLEIIQAAIDGKEIEILNPITKTWRNVPEQHSNSTLTCNFGLNTYRIKPEPKKEIKLHQYLVFNKTSGHYISTTGFFPSIKACKGHVSVWAGNWQVQYKLPHTEITVTKE